MPEVIDIINRAQELTDRLATSKDGTACPSLPQWGLPTDLGASSSCPVKAHKEPVFLLFLQPPQQLVQNEVLLKSITSALQSPWLALSHIS